MTPKGRGRLASQAHAHPRNTSTATVILTDWTSIYPLSASPAERVKRDLATTLPANRLRSIVNDYVETINAQLRPGLTMDRNGSLHGPSHVTADPALELLTAVLNTRLDAVLARHTK